MRHIITSLLITTAVMNIFGQHTKNVEGKYEYFLPHHLSRAQGEQIALERAMIEALATEFGTYISQETQINLSSSEDGEKTDFYSYASSMVKGEWMETIGQPEFGIRLTQDDEIVISCRVKGKARKIQRVVDDFDFKVLNGGTSDNFESSNFIDDDRIYVTFTAPIDGYLCIYLEDESNNFMRMLPFNLEGKYARKVNGNTRYVFFTSNDNGEEIYHLKTDKRVERNIVHALYSPNPFVLPIDYSGEDETSLDELTGTKFRKWLDKSRAIDPDMQHQMRPVTIVEPQN